MRGSSAPAGNTSPSSTPTTSGSRRSSASKSPFSTPIRRWAWSPAPPATGDRGKGGATRSFPPVMFSIDRCPRAAPPRRSIRSARPRLPCPSLLIVRRDVLDRVGGFEASYTGPLQMYEDQAFLSKVYLETHVWFSSQCWLLYRQRADSCVSENIRLGNYDRIRRHFLDWFEKYLVQHAVTDPAIWAALRQAQRSRSPGRIPPGKVGVCGLGDAAERNPPAAAAMGPVIRSSRADQDRGARAIQRPTARSGAPSRQLRDLRIVESSSCSPLHAAPSRSTSAFSSASSALWTS
jgi:hypothetical protein